MAWWRDDGYGSYDGYGNFTHSGEDNFTHSREDTYIEKEYPFEEKKEVSFFTIENSSVVKKTATLTIPYKTVWLSKSCCEEKRYSYGEKKKRFCEHFGLTDEQVFHYKHQAEDALGRDKQEDLSSGTDKITLALESLKESGEWDILNVPPLKYYESKRIVGFINHPLEYTMGTETAPIDSYFHPNEVIETKEYGGIKFSFVAGTDYYQRRKTPMCAIVIGEVTCQEVNNTVQTASPSTTSPKKKKKGKRRRGGNAIADLQSALGGDRW